MLGSMKERKSRKVVVSDGVLWKYSGVAANNLVRRWLFRLLCNCISFWIYIWIFPYFKTILCRLSYKILCETNPQYIPSWYIFCMQCGLNKCPLNSYWSWRLYSNFFYSDLRGMLVENTVPPLSNSVTIQVVLKVYKCFRPTVHHPRSTVFWQNVLCSLAKLNVLRSFCILKDFKLA